MTAAQLAEIVGPVRDLLPEWLAYHPHKSPSVSWWTIADKRGYVSTTEARAVEPICEAVLTRWLLHHHNADHVCFDTYPVAPIKSRYRVSECGVDEQGETLLQALVAAVVAARTEKK